MTTFANVIAIPIDPTAPEITQVVALLKGLDNASRTGGADFGLRTTVTYVSSNNTVETLDSGRLSIANNTEKLGDLDARTVSIRLRVALNGLPPPGSNPSFSATAQVLHGDVELGTAEQTFP